ncbi:MAG: M48 family metallopeptidase [Bacteroidota bacterium]
MPENPTLALPVQSLQPSAEFKSEVIKSIFAIVAFIVVYILLFALALVLVALCIYAGLMLIIGFPKFITLIIGAGLIGLGVMVFIFLVKFLFETNKTDLSDTIEITAAEQPQLVRFIHDIARETGTSKPKKIFLSQDVNACVFYNSSFWSMFLPVKKNLMIGLGLVNALNVSEFKAVVAHEFGHFSQRSMKLGSFVYHVNHIIYNMLYKNSGFGKGLQSFANVHGIFYMFAKLTALIVRGIQAILQQMYKLVNLSYLGLSRQMEFHADHVAGTVCGSNNIISSLERIEMADQCYQSTLLTYDKLLKENKRASDLYADHGTVFRHVSESMNRKTEGGLSLLSGPETQQVVQRVSIKNQWASHPTTPERKAYLQQFDLTGGVDHTPAWSLFQHTDDLKRSVTEKLYQHIEGIADKALVDNEAFEQFYKEDQQSDMLPKVFGSYYDNRLIESFDLEAAKELQTSTALVDILSPERMQLATSIAGLQQDIDLLKAIDAKNIETRSFDFDGTKYDRKEAGVLCVTLEIELAAKKALLIQTDKELFSFFYGKMNEILPSVATSYQTKFQQYFHDQKTADAHLVNLNEILELMQPVFSGETVAIESINFIIARLKDGPEKTFRRSMQAWIIAGAFDKEPGFRDKVVAFLASDAAYFSGESFLDNELTVLNNLVHEGWSELQQFLFDQYKTLLEMQEQSLQTAALQH